MLSQFYCKLSIIFTLLYCSQPVLLVKDTRSEATRLMKGTSTIIVATLTGQKIAIEQIELSTTTVEELKTSMECYEHLIKTSKKI